MLELIMLLLTERMQASLIIETSLPIDSQAFKAASKTDCEARLSEMSFFCCFFFVFIKEFTLRRQMFKI